MNDDDKSKTDDDVEEAAEDKEEKQEPAEEKAGQVSEAVEEPGVEANPVEEPEAQEPKADVPTDNAASTEPTLAGIDQQGRQLYNVKCSNCGKDTQVPFKPSGDRPVYCRDCYMQKKNS